MPPPLPCGKPPQARSGGAAGILIREADQAGDRQTLSTNRGRKRRSGFGRLEFHRHPHQHVHGLAAAHGRRDRSQTPRPRRRPDARRACSWDKPGNPRHSGCKRWSSPAGPPTPSPPGRNFSASRASAPDVGGANSCVTRTRTVAAASPRAGSKAHDSMAARIAASHSAPAEAVKTMSSLCPPVFTVNSATTLPPFARQQPVVRVDGLDKKKRPRDARAFGQELEVIGRKDVRRFRADAAELHGIFQRGGPRQRTLMCRREFRLLQCAQRAFHERRMRGKDHVQLAGGAVGFDRELDAHHAGQAQVVQLRGIFRVQPAAKRVRRFGFHRHRQVALLRHQGRFSSDAVAAG